MSLSIGTRLGPYEILSAIGAGGMGEVYRARDTRLSRDVAIKMLPAAFSADRDRLRRFEQEARATAALNHPNVLAVFDIGTHETQPFIVSELLEGRTLRAVLADGALSVKATLEYVVQIASGLAAAHAKEIVHRDLKPENLFVTRDGGVKILDFGLAKFREPLAARAAQTQELTGTALGLILGTASYMSPEQARGDREIDFRSDQFSLGLVLYELLAGKPAFARGSPPETLAAIIRDEAEPMRSNVPAPLRWIVDRLLAKDPGQRYGDTRDLYLELRQVREHLTEAHPVGVATGPSRPALRRRWIAWTIAVLAAGALFSAGYAARSHLAQTSEPPRFQRLTFRRGNIRSARFAPEGHSIVYAAAWEGQPPEIFSTRSDSTESRTLGLSGDSLLAISASGEMALMLNARDPGLPEWYRGTLARASLGGGAPRPIADDVEFADWAPDGTLAAVRAVGARKRVEFPVGNVIYETSDRINAMRVSPKGDAVAVAEHANGFGTNGSIAVLDRHGRKHVLATDLVGDYLYLAWAPGGQELWFTSGIEGSSTVGAVSLAGRRRSIAHGPDRLQILDVSADGRALVARTLWRVALMGRPPGARGEIDLSWFDASEVDDVSADGQTILSTEFGEGGGTVTWGVYVRKSDGSSAVRLGDGQALSLSPDGKWALSLRRSSPPELVVLPIGPGVPRTLERGPIGDYSSGNWLPDGKRILIVGTEPGHDQRCYVQAVDRGAPSAVTPEGVTAPLFEPAISPDGKWVLAVDPDQKAWLYPLEGGQPRPIAGLTPPDLPVSWSADGRSVYVVRIQGVPMPVHLVDAATGRQQLWKALAPADPTAVRAIYTTHVAPDGSWYYYSYWRNLSDLYIVEGWK